VQISLDIFHISKKHVRRSKKTKRRSGGGGRIQTEAAEVERWCDGSMRTEEEHARKRKRIGR
jgi:hypothetical protein